jgi:hypothetical protein
MNTQVENHHVVSSNSVEEAAEAAEQHAAALPPSFWQTIIIAGIASLVVASLSMAGYHYYVVSKLPKFGTVDIESVLEANQLMLMNRVTGDKVTDGDRLAAIEVAKSFGPNLDKALTQLKEECDCDLIVRSAMIIGASPDYTHRIKRLMGLGDVNVEALKLKLGNQFKMD